MQESMTLFSLFMRQSKRGGLTGNLRRLRHAMTRCWETTRSARLLSLSTFHCWRFIVVANLDAVLPTPQSNIERRKEWKLQLLRPSFRQPPHSHKYLGENWKIPLLGCSYFWGTTLGSPWSQEPHQLCDTSLVPHSKKLFFCPLRLCHTLSLKWMSHIWRATLRIVRIWRATLKLMHICRATPTVIHICRATPSFKIHL